MQDGSWPQATEIKAGPQQLATYNHSKLLRYNFKRFANREQIAANADDLSRKLAAALMQLYVTTFGFSAVAGRRGGIDPLVKHIKTVSDFLIDYHRSSPDAARLSQGAYTQQMEKYRAQWDALKQQLRKLEEEFKEYAQETSEQLAGDSSSMPADRLLDPLQEFSRGVEIGKTSSKYTLVASPRLGDYNAVWRVEHISGRPLAAKFYSRKADFGRERDMLKRLSGGHTPNYVRLFAAIENVPNTVDHYDVLVMDYCELTLKDYCDTMHATLTLNTIRFIVSDILRGLEACHAAGIVHCDMKPENVMLYSPVSTHGQAAFKYQRWVLTDFDSARLTSEPTSMNTVEYTAPEVAQAYTQGVSVVAAPAMDMWGVGRILHFMLSGRLFWPPNTTREDIINRLATSTFDVPTSNIFDDDGVSKVRELLTASPSQRLQLGQLKTSAFIQQSTPTRDLKLLQLRFQTQIDEYIAGVQATHGLQLSTEQAQAMQRLVLLRLQMNNWQSRTIPAVFGIKVNEAVIKMQATKTKRRFFPRRKSTNPAPEAMLHFFCEAEIPHLVDHPGYPIRDLADFVQKFHRVAGLSLSILQHLTGLPALPGKDTVPVQLHKELKENVRRAILKLSNETYQVLQLYTEWLEMRPLSLTLSMERIVDGRLIRVDTDTQAAFLGYFVGESQAQLAALERCVYKETHVAWLCSDCAERLNARPSPL